jgi:HTH-type transcriptional regulator/antitoxin HigA
MQRRKVKTRKEYHHFLKELDALMDLNPKLGTPESARLEELSILLEEYEKKEFPMELPDPIEAIKFRMEQQGLKRKDLIPYFGSKSKVSEVLSGKRPLSLKMIRALHEHLGISYEVLMQEKATTSHKKAATKSTKRVGIHQTVP